MLTINSDQIFFFFFVKIHPYNQKSHTRSGKREVSALYNKLMNFWKLSGENAMTLMLVSDNRLWLEALKYRLYHEDWQLAFSAITVMFEVKHGVPASMMFLLCVCNICRYCIPWLTSLLNQIYSITTSHRSNKQPCLGLDKLQLKKKITTM